MYSLPSTSRIRAPFPLAATIGSPPTPVNARTGELTPPGKISRERRMISRERELSAVTSHRYSHRERSCLPERQPGGCTRHVRQHTRAEVVIVDYLVNNDFDELAGRNRPVEISHPVDVVSLPWEPRHRPAHVARAIDDRPRARSHARFVPIRGDSALQLGQPLQTLALEGVRHVVGHFRRARTFLGRVGERADAIELQLLEKLEKLLEVAIGFSGKSCDARRSYRHPRDCFTETRHAIADRPLSLGTSHRGEDAIRPVLDGHVQVR